VEPRQRVFARLWGVAALAHLAGNASYGDLLPSPELVGVLLACLGVVATAVIVRPGPRLTLLLMGLVVLTAAAEVPVLGNHWLLAAVVALGYLVTGGRWHRFEPLARTVLLLFYSFAAFAKLNTGFLDPVTSCGLFHLNEASGALGLPPLAAGSPVATLAAWAPAAIELSVPLLLLVPATRRAGVLLAVGFHTLLSFDLAQHFYDFTAVLLPLFLLFLDDSVFERIDGWGRVGAFRARTLLRGAVLFVGITVTAANVLPESPAAAAWLAHGSFGWWAAYVALLGLALLGPRRGAVLAWRLGPAGLAVAALVVANGLSPYLEVKSAFGWTMYSNLVLVDGTSNHLLVRASWPLRDEQEDLVRVLSSDDPGLEAYVAADYLLPWPTFRTYVASRPGIAVTYARAGRTVVVDRVGESNLAEPVPWWWHWMPLRAVHATTPATCQAVFLPAL
jgi:Vitamin K-dependent gamma-carboxylase